MPLGKVLDFTLIPQRRLRGKNRKGTVCLRCVMKPGLGGYPNTILIPSPIFFSAVEIAVISRVPAYGQILYLCLDMDLFGWTLGPFLVLIW